MELLFIKEYLLKHVSSFNISPPVNFKYFLSGYLFFNSSKIDVDSLGVWSINIGLLLIIAIITIIAINTAIPIMA